MLPSDEFLFVSLSHYSTMSEATYWVSFSSSHFCPPRPSTVPICRLPLPNLLYHNPPLFQILYLCNYKLTTCYPSRERQGRKKEKKKGKERKKFQKTEKNKHQRNITYVV